MAANTKAPAKKKAAAPKKKAAPKKQANSLSAKEQDAIQAALAEAFAGRTSPYKVAAACLKVWKATTPRKKWDNEPWARYIEGFGT